MKTFGDESIIEETTAMIQNSKTKTCGIVITVTGGEQEIILEKGELKNALKLLDEEYPEFN